MLCTLALLAATGCGEGSDDSQTAEAATPPAGLPQDKLEAEALSDAGKADWSLDPCEHWGWYGDSECDWFCPSKDPDCELPRPAGLTLKDSYAFPDRSLYPESVSYDEGSKSFFVGSLTRDRVVQVTADGTVRIFSAGSGEAKRTTLGVKTDTARNRLVVCSYLSTSPATGRIWVFDLTSGQQTHDIDLTKATPNGTCGDVLVTASGDIFATDRDLANVYKVTARADGTGEAVVWASDPLLSKPALGFGQNGIALTPDDSALLITQYLPPKLYRISTRDPRDVSRVELSGPTLLPGFVLGFDGMVRLGDDFYITYGSHLLRVRFDDDSWKRAQYDMIPVGAKISSVTVAQGQLYVLRSDIPKFVLRAPKQDFGLTRIDPGVFDL